MIADMNLEHTDDKLSNVNKEESCEEETSDNETNYFDSLCPKGDNKEYVDKLKENIVNLRREYSISRENLGEEHLVKRSFLEDFVKTTTNPKKRSNSSNTRYRDKDNSHRLAIKGDVWFGCSRFEDSGERLGGGRRSKERGGEKIVRLKNTFGFGEENMKQKKEKQKKVLDHVSKTNISEEDLACKMYQEIMEVVKEKSPPHLSYGKERMAAWLLESRLQ